MLQEISTPSYVSLYLTSPKTTSILKLAGAELTADSLKASWSLQIHLRISISLKLSFLPEVLLAHRSVNEVICCGIPDARKHFGNNGIIHVLVRCTYECLEKAIAIGFGIGDAAAEDVVDVK
ncbi:hypothetical protein MKW98_001208 [Papaver atlanticum]|uniref:Uncharacterized protein n=1 Tax=Papaver atlanticum TaxID=357466 RepID=A0AAD4STE6_9MAGN|nr:hypothetical protein MKW98_001208 [Papaver atlanticum]